MHHTRSLIASKPWLLAVRKNYTAAEVRQRLQVDRSDDPRTVAVHAAAAQTSIWSSLLSRTAAFDLGRAADRLPTIVYWYRLGLSPCEIGRRLSPLGGAWDANCALDAAAALIARALNSAPAQPRI
jgi:hypothetical protein